MLSQHAQNCHSIVTNETTVTLVRTVTVVTNDTAVSVVLVIIVTECTTIVVVLLALLSLFPYYHSISLLLLSPTSL